MALYVKKHFVKQLTALTSFKSRNYRLALEEVFLKLDEVMLTDSGMKELLKMSKPDESYQSYMSKDVKTMAGCTATVVLITPKEIYCCNAGDSRTVLSKAKKSHDMSEDHKPNNPDELRRIVAANGFVEDNRVNGMLALSRALGDFEYKSNSLLKAKDQQVTAMPEIKCTPITADVEFICLACDGIWDVKTSQETITYLHQACYPTGF